MLDLLIWLNITGVRKILDKMNIPFRVSQQETSDGGNGATVSGLP